MSTVAIMSRYVNESRKIAEQTAFRLGFPLVAMSDLVKAAAREGNVPESELSAALTDISLFHQFFRKRKLKLVSLMESVLCDFMAEKEMVFCGYLGYPIFQEVSHVLQVLVLGHPEEAGSGAGVRNTQEELFSDDNVLKWFKKIYHVDMEAPNLYDLSINLWHMDESEGADIIINTLKQPRFTPMTYSRKVMKDLRLAFRIRSKLIEKMPDIAVKSHDGTVYVYSKVFKRGRKKAVETKQLIMWMDGVDYVEILNDKKTFQSA